MAETTQTYGKNLPDQVDRLASLSDAQIELLDDVREHFRERSALEREYAGKLQLLARKLTDKKGKKITALVVGTEPTKAWDDNTIEQSSLSKAYSQLITSVMQTAEDHIHLAEALNSQVIEALRITGKRHEDYKRKQMQYFSKLLSERERVYADRTKFKQKYDEECTEVETYRQKQDRSADDRHAERAAKQYEQQQADMLNSKNVYLIGTAVANRVKAKFYTEDLPALEDQFQDLQTQLLKKLSSIVVQSQTLQSNHLDKLKSRAAAAETAFNAIAPPQDQCLFIEHNVRSFTAPPDWSFEPCSTYYDTDDMSVEPAPKIYLQNRLTRCRQKREELLAVLAYKRQEVERLGKLIPTYIQDQGSGNADEVVDDYIEGHHQLAFYTTSECILTTEIETISAALGGDEGGQSPHSFKGTSFSIPTQCGYCKSTIWGLSKLGKTCKACGISVHAKCELKVPADCPGAHGSQSGGPRGNSHPSAGSTLQPPPSRTPSTLSTASRASSASATPTPSSFAHLSSSIHSIAERHPSARVLYDYTPTSPFELAVSEGEVVHLLEEDDGSGWAKVASTSGGNGLVPASYVELVAEEPTTSPAPQVVPSINRATKPQQGSKKKFVRSLYDYQAQGPDELPLREGEMIELTTGPTGGQNYSGDWWEGVDSSGKKGVFPSNYVETVS